MKDWFDHILFHTRAQPQKPAIVMEDRVVTYGMLGLGIERCARRIVASQAAGNGPVAVMVQNPIRHLTLCLALTRIGVPSVSLEHDQTGIAGLKFAAVLGDREAARRVAPGNRFIEAADEWFSAGAPGSDALPEGFRGGRPVCRISLTSGSTGAPAQVPHSVEGVGQRILEKILGCVDASTTAMLCLPGLSSILGFSTSCAALTAGRTLCFAENFAQAVRMIDLFSVDVAMTATEQLLMLTRAAQKSGAQLRSLRTVWVTGSTPTRPLLEAAMAYVCKDIFCRYGVSEVGLLARTTARELLAEPTLAGHLAPGVEVAAFDPQGRRLPPGQTGILKRRRDNEDDSDLPHEQDSTWVDLGDLGWVTAGGQLHVAGRVGEAAATPVNLSPIHEIEHLVRLKWDIDNAAAVLAGSGADELWIAVVGSVRINAEEVEALARPRGIRQPIRLFYLPVIPRGANGKVNRAELKAMMQQSVSGIAVSR